MAYDIFISYRRKGAGAGVAGELQAKLTNRGYNVFLDVDEIVSGTFPEQIDHAIRESSDFLLILSSGMLDRCVDENDWVRHEIMLAEELKKNIIGVALPGFIMPEAEELPEPLRDLPNKQVFLWSHEYRNASIEKVVQNLVSSEKKKKRKKNRSLIIAIVSLLVVGAGVVLGLQQGKDEPEISPIEEVKSPETHYKADFDQHIRKADSLLNLTGNLSEREEFETLMLAIAELDTSLVLQRNHPDEIGNVFHIVAQKDAVMTQREEKMNVEIQAAEAFVGVDQPDFAQFRLDNAKILAVDADQQRIDEVQREIDKLKK